MRTFADIESPRKNFTHLGAKSTEKDPPILPKNPQNLRIEGLQVHKTGSKINHLGSIVGLPNLDSTVGRSGLEPKRRTYKKRWKPPGESLSPGNTVSIRNFLRKESDLAKEPKGKRKLDENTNLETSKKPKVGKRTTDI